ncbi:MAG: hypothetical protein KJO82_04065 [Gammaproteobacteria bacterium]|nr:hypothetical protein [Gammaproteobacteria bacterium]
MAKRQTKKAGAENSDIDGNVDKIREILFGGQMRDYEGRFADLEKRLSQRIDHMDAEIEKRLERLNGYARREVDKLTDKLKNERKDRIQDSKEGAQEIKDVSNQMEVWFGEVEDRLDAETKDLRSAIHEQSEELAELIAETREHLNAAIQAESQQLGDAKLAREDLAGVLTEVALRLKKDFKLPKG